MPSKRSLGCITFITCEDPRGVAEYGTIRKSKSTPTHKKEHGKNLIDIFNSPSTSLRQSPIVHSCQMKKDKKAKRPNMIAKPFSKNEKIRKQKKPTSGLPPIVILRPWCVDLEHPIVPKSRGEVYDEAPFLGMRVRTNPLAQAEGAYLGNSKSHFVEKNAFVSNGNRRYKGAMSESSKNADHASQIEISVADYVNDDQSSPNTSLEEEKPFIRCVEELFDNGIKLDEISARELVDTTNELISLHSLRCSRSAFLPKTCHCCSSFERLLEEVCDEIRVLRSYRTVEGNNRHWTDNSILLLLKGDLRTQGMGGGMWDMGWRNAGSVDDITRGIQEMVLDGLIEEIIFCS